MVTAKRLLAKDGAQFYTHTRPGGYNQVILVTQVRLGDKHEPETETRTNPAKVRDIAEQLARDVGFPVAVWE